MDRYDNIYDKIQELLGCIPGNVHILEEQIDADVQVEYYNFARNLQSNMSSEETLQKMDTIFTRELPVEDKKSLIIQLAGTDSIEAYRTLERYTHGEECDLKDWAKIAMQECRLLLESKFLDENHVLISTGLGGKGLKLRYFTVFLARNERAYSAFQRKIINDEVSYSVNKSMGDLEKIDFDNELCTILSIIPLQIPVQHLFKNVITECNQYGNFINKDFIITNVKIIPNEEIRELVIKNRQQNKTRKQ